MTTPLRVVFFGTPDFAVPTLSRLQDGPHRVVAVVSQPDRPRGRGRKHSPSPVAAFALAAGLPLLRPNAVGASDVETALHGHSPDVGVVVAFGQFLPRRLRTMPTCGYLINAHASLLPKLRGAAPIARAILGGEWETGISVMRVDREMDAGPVALVKRTPIGADEDGGSLEARLSMLAADAIAEALAEIAASRLRFDDQPTVGVTFAPKLERADARLDFRQPAELLVRQVRAFAPRPGAFTELAGEPLRILKAHPEPGSPADAPGRVSLSPDRRALRIATGAGWLSPSLLQRAGGRALEVVEFLRGARLSDGIVLGS